MIDSIISKIPAPILWLAIPIGVVIIAAIILAIINRPKAEPRPEQSINQMQKFQEAMERPVKIRSTARSTPNRSRGTVDETPAAASAKPKK